MLRFFTCFWRSLVLVPRHGRSAFALATSRWPQGRGFWSRLSCALVGWSIGESLWQAARSAVYLPKGWRG